MCGITGIISNEIDVQKYVRQHNKLEHRGKDDEGFLVIGPDSIPRTFTGVNTPAEFQGENVTNSQSLSPKAILGHHRLSIHDLTANGHQPMSDSSQKYWLVHNGEIYNYKEIGLELADSYEFKSDSDSEVILAAYSQWGDDCWEKFNGMWAVALLDIQSQKLMLSRDRFGVKPLYYSHSGFGFLFGSEAKFFHDYLPLNLNEQLAKEYLGGLLMDHREETLFDEVQQVQPGQTITLDLVSGLLEKKSYWSIHDHLPSHEMGDETEMLAEFNRIFDDSVRIRMDSDVPVGGLLSGGLDSTSIVCNVASKLLRDKDSFNTFSVVYDDKAVSEESYIQDTLQRYQQLTPNFINPSTDTLLNNMDKVMYLHDFPLRGLNVLCWYELYQWIQANTNVRVTYSGQGADEIFAGYREHYNSFLVSLSRGSKSDLDREMSFIDQFGEYPLSMQQSIVDAGERQFMARGTVKRKPFFFNEELEYSVPQFDQENPLRDSLAKHLTFSALREFLRYEDRNSMGATIESRAPFMDYRLVEFAFKVPNSMKIRNGERKYVVKKATQNYNGKAVLARVDKQGFDSPQESWQRNQLRPFLDKMIGDIDMNFIDKDALIKGYRAYQNGDRNDWRLWGQLAAFQRWRELYGV